MTTKIFWLIFSLLLFSSIINAQSYETIMEYNKAKQPVVAIAVKFSKDVTTDAIKDFYKKNAYSVLENKGFLTVLRVKSTTSGKEKEEDQIYRIEKIKGVEASTIYLFTRPSLPKTDQKPDTMDVPSIKNQLNAFPAIIEAYDLEQQIIRQQESVAKAEKKLVKLQDEQSSLEKKLKKLEDNSAETKQDIEKIKTQMGANTPSQDLEKLKKKLNNLEEDQINYEKRRTETQQDLLANRQNQDRQKTEIDTQRNAYSQLKSKRK